MSHRSTIETPCMRSTAAATVKIARPYGSRMLRADDEAEGRLEGTSIHPERMVLRYGCSNGGTTESDARRPQPVAFSAGHKKDGPRTLRSGGRPCHGADLDPSHAALRTIVAHVMAIAALVATPGF